MPPKKKQPEIPNADALIMAEADGEELYVRNFEQQSEAERIIESDVHQLKVLSLFGAINRKEFILRHPESLKKQGRNAGRSLEAIKQGRDDLVGQAQSEFWSSLHYADRKAELADAGKPTDDLDREMKRAWTIFQGRFRRPEHSAARGSKVRALRQEVKTLQTVENRELGRRPHRSDKELRDLQQDVLTSRERLVAIWGDSRAGFIPASDKEKIMTFTDLDYLDNPRYPLSIVNQRLEVFNHQAGPNVTSEKYTKRELPDRTTRTLVYELHDYWTNAQMSLTALQGLEQLVGECYNPNVSIGEEAGNHPGINVLIRFRDLERWRDRDIKPRGIRNPLSSKEDRRPHTDPQKNKTIEDIYTRREADPEMLAYIAEEADKLTIGEARSLIERAISNEENRELFMRRRLEDIYELAPKGSNYLSISQLAGRLITQARILPLEYSA